MEVTQALQETSKGRLDYGHKLKNQQSVQKLHLLDTYNLLPPFSPEIEKYLLEKTTRTSGSYHHAIVTDPIQGQITEEYSPIREIVPSIVEEVDHPTQKIFEEFSESSVIGDINRERLDYEILLDDRLVEESNTTIELKKVWFQKQLQKLEGSYRAKLKQEQNEQQRKLKQYQETMRLEDIRKSVAINEWKQRTLEQYRAEEERVKAKLVDGELQTTMLKEEQMKTLCVQYLRDCAQLRQDFDDCFKNCKYPQNVAESVIRRQRSAMESCTALQANLEQPDGNQVDNFVTHFSKLKLLLEHVRVAVQEANVQGAEQAEKEQKALQLELEQKSKLKLESEQNSKLKLEQMSKLQLELEQKSKLEEEKKKQKEEQELGDQKQRSTTPTDGEMGMPRSMLSCYAKLQDMMSRTSSCTSSFTGSRDLTTKKYRFDLQKAVNTTVNSISANSGESLLEKIYHLQRLFGGQSVDVMGNPVNIAQHPEAKLYCCNLLAKKLVKQGEDQVSSNIEAAFPIAAVAIGLWTKYPEIGEHMLAHFYSSCPCLVPLYIQKTDDITNIDHMRLQGYKVSADGKVETEDMFLHRVRGMVRLYAAIISSPQLPMDQTLGHPHGLEHGWAWLARVLNMEPHPTLTAAALGDFLEIAGHALKKKYGRQFQKLMYTLCRHFIPKMEKCTPLSERGPISRLTQFLEICVSAGSFPEPKGYLHSGFWRTRAKGISFA